MQRLTNWTARHLGALALLTIAGLSSGCGREKSEALAEVEKIEKLCAAGERDKAQEEMLATASKNKVFAKSFQFVTAALPDKTVVDACGDPLPKLKQHLIEEQ
ncbi:MAG TPA: hypothetical protein VGJ84_11680 [Polyangiaceae bacterium]|jgi:hypothetical protein